MADTWPFGGRVTELDQIRLAAAGVVVAGPAGVGKTTLVAQAVPAEPSVAWVRATAAAAEVPLGAFAPFLPSTPPEGNPLGWAAAALTMPTLVVDDAHLLDSASAALVHHLVAHRDHRVIVSVRSGEQMPDAVRALWKDALLPRLDLQPLTAEEIDIVLRTALGGRVESSALARLWELTRGNALYLRELVLAGALTEVGGVWRWRGPGLPITPSLRDTIAHRIGTLTAGEREAMELLAYGEPLGVVLSARLVGADTVERLEDRRLVVVERDGRRLEVRLAHPLYGEVIRSGCGLLRTRTLLRRLADTVGAAGQRRREDVLRVAVWRLDSDSPDDPDLLLTASETAKMVRDLALAERLARAAVEAGGGTPALVRLGTVLSYAGRHEEAEETFAAAWVLDMDDWQRIELIVGRSHNLAFGLGRLSAAVAVIDEAAELITTAFARHGLAGCRAAIMTFAGDISAARRLNDQVKEVSRSLPRGVVAYGANEAHILVQEGRAGECLELVRETRAELDRHPYDMPGMTARLTDIAALASLVLGDLDSAERHCDDGYRLDGRFGTWHRVIVEFATRRAEVLRLRGRLADALGWAQEAVARTPARSVLACACLGEVAHMRALLGDAAGAEAALTEAEEADLAVSPLLSVHIGFARVWASAARGDLARAVELALAAADLAPICYAAFALHDLVRLGRPDLAAARLAELPIAGPLMASFVRHAAARSGPEFDAVSRDLERIGLTLYAAEAAATAASRYQEEGVRRGARAAESRAWLLAAGCQGARTPTLTNLTTPRLTPRQREVAVLAAQGMSNREIAERLCVSIRTVANTLCAVYERTGINDRSALADLLK